MSDLTALLSEMCWAQIIQVTLVILLVGLVTRLLLQNRPFLALALWTIVLIKCVTPPVFYSPSGLFCWIDTRDSTAEKIDRTLAAQALPAALTGDSGLVATEAEVIRDIASTVGTIAARLSTDTTQWHSAVIVIWLTGALGMLLANIVRTLRFLRRLETDRVAPDASIGRLVRRLSRYVGLRRPPPVMISKSNIGPAVFGVLRPTIILPLALVHECRLRQLTPIALHELIHVRHGDLWLALQSMVVRVIWWFHPLVWWAVRRAEWESERCCDESVVALMQRDPARYAHSLIDALTQSHRLQRLPFAAGMRPVDITAVRLERVMDLRHGSHKRMPLSCWIFGLMAAALVLPGATGSLAQPPDTDELLSRPVLPGTEWLRPPRPIDPNVQPARFEAGTEPKAAETITTRLYDVADLLKKMREEEAWPKDAPDEQVKLALASFFQACSPGIRAAARQASVASLPLAPKGESEFEWSGNQLVVSASEAVHESLVKEIALRRRHSFRQVTVEVRIMQAGSSLCTPSDSRTEEADEQSNWRNRWILFQQEFTNLESELRSHKVAESPLDPEIPNLPPEAITAQYEADVPKLPTAAASSGTSDPIVYQFVTDQEMRSFVSVLESDARANILFAPKVTLFDGQTALISDTAQCPFVTDVQQFVGDRGVAYQPVIKVLWEGTKIQLSPAITPNGHRMNCQIMFAAIKDCRQFSPPRYPDAKEMTIQHPIASTSSFECSIDIPAGQTLLIGGLFPAEREYNAEPSMISWLLPPKRIVRQEMTYIAITLRTLESE